MRMKKLFLLLACVALSATQSFGYDVHKYGDNSYYFQLSPNGEWLLGGDWGSVVICHTPDSTVYSYVGDEVETFYDASLGNSVSNNGVVVGSTDDYTPAYWKDGVWTTLPLKDEASSYGYSSMGNGITPDGSVICGVVGLSAGFGNSNYTTLLPAIWTRNADGTYGGYEILPHPDTDYTGRAPQCITARYISDDGCTVAGQIVSYDGFAYYPIVYTKSADGEWSYKIYGLEAICDYDGEWPPYPNYEPDEPLRSDYMTDEEKAAYQDALDQYYAGTLYDYPTYADYMGDESKAAYDKDHAKWAEDYEAYSDSVAAFEEVYYTYFTGTSYVWNTVALSGNGKYLMQTIQMDDPDGGDTGFDDPWGSSLITTPVLFDLESGEMSSVDASNMIGSSVTNDGTIFAGAPYREYTRQAYVVEMGSTEPVRFDTWMAAKCQPVADWMSENMLYDVINYVYDEDSGEYTEEVVADSLFTGSLVSNAEGTRFVTYVCDQWTTYAYDSYLIDIADTENPTAIKTVAKRQDADMSISVADGRIDASGVESIALYDMQGRKVADARGSLSANVAKGVYVVKGTAADGSAVSRKVAVGE